MSSMNREKIGLRSIIVAFFSIVTKFTILLHISNSIYSDAFSLSPKHQHTRRTNINHYRASSSAGTTGTASGEKEQKLTAHPPLPELTTSHGFGSSDEEFEMWLRKELVNVAGRQTYSHVFEQSIGAVLKWRKRYRGNPRLWKRIFKKDRVVKELVEAAPIIDTVLHYVNAYENNGKEDEKITILDLCSGKGYLSMFLSELLPDEKVNKLILIDKAWAMCNTELLPHHINWDHIYGKIPITTESDDSTDTVIQQQQDETYFTTWPIPLHTSKQDLKQSCNQRQMKKHFFDRINGPIVVLAIHLCGTLSLKAVDMFNNHDNVSLFVLKPCCLPTMVYAQRGEIFKIGNHEFKAEDVCSNGTFNKKDWSGPPRWHLEGKFEKWTENLYQGVLAADQEDYGSQDVNDGTVGKKKKENIGKSRQMIFISHFITMSSNSKEYI